MSGANLQHLLAMILYMAAVVGIGIYFAVTHGPRLRPPRKYDSASLFARPAK